ncbi:hypothetical protein EPUL_003921 [Erysiphe pulchra]|uniref:RNase H type-1 domain-containing protein n=1 Tax=Erysiphe pulchra TaxID=225359 RepID=A0A2S4PPU0_9PEZI|nr:hypothetical protein EPUL_003921 [Erysiphe pulchra]
MAKFATNVAVCLDNEDAAIRLHTGNLTPFSCKNYVIYGTTSPGTVIVRCIPGHASMAGNDSLVKSACNEATLRIKASISRATRLLNERYEVNITSYWENKAPERYKYLKISMSGKMPEELCFLNCRILGLLLSARSEHGNYAAYHRRFKHDDATPSVSAEKRILQKISLPAADWQAYPSLDLDYLVV